MKKLGILLLAIIASFIISYDAYSGEWNYVEDPSSIKEFLPVTTTLATNFEENLEKEKDIQAKTNYGNAWNSLMKPDIVLSRNERALTDYVSVLDRWVGDKGDYEDQTFNTIYVNGDRCQLQWNRMGWAVLDRVHPYAESNSYRYFQSAINVTYGCSNPAEFELGTYEYFLYGPLFYYENTWWIFSEIPATDPINYRVLNICEDPCGTNAQALATMVPVDTSNYLYSITLPRDVGRINGYHDFIDNVFVPQNDSEIFYEVSEESTVGPSSGTYLYKDSAYDLAMYECEKDGFTVSECETTATYEWENLNKVSGLQFKDIACADEMNTEIALYIETFVDGIVGDILPIYTGFFTDEYEQIKFSVLNLEDKKPEEYITFMLQGYYASGGTMRYPYEKFFTYDLKNCTKVVYADLFNIEFPKMKNLIFKYIGERNDGQVDDYVSGSHRIDEEFLLSNTFISKDSLYISFRNALPYSWNHLFMNPPEEITEEYINKELDGCEPSYWDVPCNSYNSNKFSGFLAIPLDELDKYKNWDPEIAFENFKSYWNSNIKSPKPFSNNDKAITDSLKKWPDSIVVNETIICHKRVRGTLSVGVADENHPVDFSDHQKLAWWLSESYVCSDEVITNLYGSPFFQDGKWWIFAATNYPPNLGTDELYKDCGYPCSPVSNVRFATRVNINLGNDG